MAQQKIADNQRGEVTLDDTVIDLMTRAALGYKLYQKDIEKILNAKVHIDDAVDTEESMLTWWTGHKPSPSEYKFIYLSPTLQLKQANGTSPLDIDYSNVNDYHTYILTIPQCCNSIQSHNSWLIQVNESSDEKYNDLYINGKLIKKFKKKNLTSPTQIMKHVFEKIPISYKGEKMQPLYIVGINTAESYHKIGVTAQHALDKEYINESGLINRLTFLRYNTCSSCK